MGCNLCTLQKREEHYKLLYEIAQVSEEEEELSGSRTLLGSEVLFKMVHLPSLSLLHLF